MKKPRKLIISTKVKRLTVSVYKAMSFKDDSILANLDVAMEKIIEVHNKYWQEKQVKNETTL